MELFNTFGGPIRNEFNINVHELDEHSPRIAQPTDIGVTLKDHQLTIIKRCMDYENGNIFLRDFSTIQSIVNPEDFMSTKIGIISDRVGSGKSYVVLSIIKMNNICNMDRAISRSCGLNNVMFCLKGVPKVRVKTSVVVIPFNLCKQWETYIRKFGTDMTWVIVNKGCELHKLQDDENMSGKLNTLDIIFVTSTLYNRFAYVMEINNITFQRVFYDEADSINIKACTTIPANFYWFVTASYGNLLYPRGFTCQDMTSRRYVLCASGLMFTGFLRAIFTELYSQVPLELIKALVVKNSESYVQSSIHLPPMNVNIIKCKTPFSISVLNGLVDTNIIACLNAGDIQKAIQYVNPVQIMSEDNIIAATIEKYTKKLANMLVRQSVLDRLTFDTQSEREHEENTLKQKKNELEGRIAAIKERIQTADLCVICYDEHVQKTFVQCCQNSFCFKCINLWLNKKPTCPYCKQSLTATQLYVLNKDGASCSHKEEPEMPPKTVGGVAGFSANHDKLANLKVLLKAKQRGSKILIFSSFEYSFGKIIPILDKYKIKYEFLKGTGYHVNMIINNYKNGDVDVLLVNTTHYGSGFNMENTTDVIMFHKFDSEIEKQVVGRAQRCGREHPLNVWYLMHENE